MAVIPDGRIDVFFLHADNEPFKGVLLGIETKPSTAIFSSKSCFFGISFKLLAVEYILDTSIASLLNDSKPFPNDLLDLTAEDLADFEALCHKVSIKVNGLIKPKIDDKKRKLFDLVYATHGTLTVKEYAEKVIWSSRQINRYFNKMFGLSLKAFCNILRFKASFQQLKEGKLYPELNFSDQAHFIREVKKLAGVTPKELAKNENDRFVQFSSLSR